MSPAGNPSAESIQGKLSRSARVYLSQQKKSQQQNPIDFVFNVSMVIIADYYYCCGGGGGGGGGGDRGRAPPIRPPGSSHAPGGPPSTAGDAILPAGATGASAYRSAGLGAAARRVAHPPRPVMPTDRRQLRR